MISCITIKNFRGFKDLTIDKFNDVNLIIGKNNVGKTALLEAVYSLLLVNNTNHVNFMLNLDKYRGFDVLPLNLDALFGWLFHNRNTKTPITINCSTKNHLKHEMVIKLLPSSSVQINADNDTKQNIDLAESSDHVVLKINYSNSEQQDLEITAKNSQGRIDVTNPLTLASPLFGRVTIFQVPSVCLYKKKRSCLANLKILGNIKRSLSNSKL